MAHDTIRLENEVKRLRAIIRDGVPDQGSDCPECGFMVPVDEDGLCISCGRDVMWYHPAIYKAKALKADNTRLRASLAAAEEWQKAAILFIKDVREFRPFNEDGEELEAPFNVCDYHAMDSLIESATLPKQDSGQVEQFKEAVSIDTEPFILPNRPMTEQEVSNCDKLVQPGANPEHWYCTCGYMSIGALCLKCGRTRKEGETTLDALLGQPDTEEE